MLLCCCCYCFMVPPEKYNDDTKTQIVGGKMSGCYCVIFLILCKKSWLLLHWFLCLGVTSLLLLRFALLGGALHCCHIFFYFCFCLWFCFFFQEVAVVNAFLSFIHLPWVSTPVFWSPPNSFFCRSRFISCLIVASSVCVLLSMRWSSFFLGLMVRLWLRISWLLVWVLCSDDLTSMRAQTSPAYWLFEAQRLCYCPHVLCCWWLSHQMTWHGPSSGQVCCLLSPIHFHLHHSQTLWRLHFPRRKYSW